MSLDSELFMDILRESWFNNKYEKTLEDTKAVIIAQFDSTCIIKVICT